MKNVNMLMEKGGDMNIIATLIWICFGVFSVYVVHDLTNEVQKCEKTAHEFCLSASGGEENVCKEVLK